MPHPSRPRRARQLVRLLALALAGPASLAQAQSSTPADSRVAAGAAVYQARCAACHSADFNGIGPAHRAVFGRPAGRVAGFSYSPALSASGLVWSAENLDKWLADPERLVPGQRMGVTLDDAQMRADVIAYLMQLKPRE